MPASLADASALQAKPSGFSHRSFATVDRYINIVSEFG